MSADASRRASAFHCAATAATAWVCAQSLRLLPAAAGCGRVRFMGGEPVGHADARRVLPARRQGAAVRGRLHDADVRPQPRQHDRHHGGGAAGGTGEGVRARRGAARLHGTPPAAVP